MTGTIQYLREAAKKLNSAADRLEAQDSYHHEHALELIGLSIKDQELCKRHIHRELDKRYDEMRRTK